ncbi:MAG: MerR family transcriptional regulator [Rhodobacteraceae bacterium]|nr:MerR family transcriptional regulator [Paracoccaceae bacterium]
MRKAPEAFRTISEVAEILRTPAHVLRFWESKFTQVKPVKRAGGRRYYRPSDLALLGGIRALLHDQGMTIRGVQKLLAEKGVRHVAGLAPESVLAELEGDVLEQEAGEVADDAAPAPAATPAAAPSDDPPRPETPAEAAGAPGAEATGDAAPADQAAAPDPVQESPPTASEDAAQPPGVTARETDDPAPPPQEEPAGPAAAAAQGSAPPDTAGSEGSRDPGSGAAAEGGTDAAAPAETPARETPPEAEADSERLAVALRRIGDAPNPDQRAALAAVARRVDALLDRMSKAGGAERW